MCLLFHESSDLPGASEPHQLFKPEICRSACHERNDKRCTALPQEGVLVLVLIWPSTCAGDMLGTQDFLQTG